MIKDNGYIIRKPEMAIPLSIMYGSLGCCVFGFCSIVGSSGQLDSIQILKLIAAGGGVLLSTLLGAGIGLNATQYSDKVPSNRKIGYTSQQDELDSLNARFSTGVSPYLDRLRTNAHDLYLIDFLLYISQTYQPQKIFYPFSGWHTVPRSIFDDKVIHASLDYCHPHLKDLEWGNRVQMDVRRNAFADKSFDAVFIRGTQLADQELHDYLMSLRKTVKDGGLFIVDGHDEEFAMLKKLLPSISFPDESPHYIRNNFALFLNADLPRRKFFR